MLYNTFGSLLCIVLLVQDSVLASPRPRPHLQARSVIPALPQGLNSQQITTATQLLRKAIVGQLGTDEQVAHSNLTIRPLSISLHLEPLKIY